MREIEHAPQDQADVPQKLRWTARSVFALLLASYAFFWHSRDWNTASRLLLTYSLGDRVTISLDGLNIHTNDLAKFRGHYYSDKQPGYAFLALPVYGVAKPLLGLSSHPLSLPKAMTHWRADYWVTLATSGVLTALCGALLVHASGALGCGPRRAALVGLGYGLGTPASVYATLAYGHQAATTMLVAAFLLVVLGRHRAPGQAFAAGLLASYAATIELSVAPVAAVVAALCLSRVVRRSWPTRALLLFGIGVAGPLVFLLTYNTLAFGSPFEMGYAHHVVARFRALHGRGNPLGLTAPRWELAPWLLFSEYRGLFIYAPILILAPVGWLSRRPWSVDGMRAGSVAACVAVFLVNLSYPEWTGGWSTGPRLLLPLLPFGMLAVAAALGMAKGSWKPLLISAALVLSLAGVIIQLGCQAIDGRIPEALGADALAHPLQTVVWPLASGAPIPEWREGVRFGRNLVNLAWPGWNDDSRVAPSWQWLQFAPLLALWAVGIVLLLKLTAAGRTGIPQNEAGEAPLIPHQP